jgi:Ca2+-transporting ATPase
MAGDGVNDAPAIKAADVGIVIGRRASDVSREAADIVLASEDMRSIIDAIGEGRVVQDNLRRALRYLLATNLSEIVLALGSAAVGARESLTPIRLLWLNLLSDTVPALALATEPADGDVLGRPPASPDTPLVAPEAVPRLVRDGLWMAGLAAASQAVAGPAGAFSALAGADIGYAFACRAPTSAPNERFLRLLGGTAGLHLAAIAFPPLRALLRLPPALSPLELVAFGAGFALPLALAPSGRDQLVVRRGRDLEETT